MNNKIDLKNPLVVAILALLCCALWGSAFPCIKIGYEMFNISNTGSQILFAGYRFFLAGILAFITSCIIDKKFITMKTSSVPFIFGQGILQTTIQYVLFYIGLANTTGTKGSVINASNAFFSIIFAYFLIKGEKLSWQKIVGCIIGFAGVIAVNMSGADLSGDVSFLGEGMILLCAMAYGLSSVTTKIISSRESTNTITSYQLLFGGLVLIIIGLVLGGSVHGFTLKSTILLIYMALLSSVAFSIWAALLKHNPVGKVAIFGFSIPIFGVALSAIFLGETIFTLQNLIALVLVSIGIIIVNKE